jgi:ABC-type amino acid transport system permease subunit
MLNLSGHSGVRALARVYIEIYRNTPLLTQLYFIFFGLPFLGIQIPSFEAAAVAIGMQHAAFYSEIFRGTIGAIGRGQYDAAYALGFSRRKAMLRVMVPQAVRDAIPAIGSQTVLVLQDTSLASTVGVVEITLRGYALGEDFAAGFEMFVLVGALYLVLQTVVGLGLRTLEAKYRVRR